MVFFVVRTTLKTEPADTRNVHESWGECVCGERGV